MATEVLKDAYEKNKTELPINTTTGIHTAKHTPEEWIQHNYAKYYQSFTDRENAERNQHESQKLANETHDLMKKTQKDSTKKLGERLHDIAFWKFELQREIEDILKETDLLLKQQVRLEKAKDATQIPLEIAFDNMRCRDRRYNADLVRDAAEIELLKEINLIKSVQDILQRTIDQTKAQVESSRVAKHRLEHDWSDKVDAYRIDDKCGRLNNESTDIQYYADSAKFEENSSTPETWAQFTHENIVHAERERMASINLRSLIDNVLNDTSNDMRHQCNLTNTTLQQRVDEMNGAKVKLQNHLQKTIEEIGNQEKNIKMLREAIFAKRAPMQVAQTRLDHRTYRPGVELCRDPAQYRIVTEVGELTESIELLHTRLAEAENSLRALEDTRLSLEKEIACKKNSIFIDQHKCLSYRSRWPSVTRMAGY